MGRSLRLLLAGACAAGLLAPPLAAAVDATVRVEGASATLVPETTVALGPPATTVTVTDSFDADRFDLPADRATVQLDAAADRAGVPVGYDVFDFGSLVQRIGDDAAPPPPAFAPFWRLKVNDKITDVGADQVALAEGDRVTWAFVDDFEAPELELTLSAGAARVGETVQARVVKHDNAGAETPAAGATVSYRGGTVTVGADGTAALRAEGSGGAAAVASLAGSVRSESRSLCSYADDPTVCGLPAIPPPTSRPLCSGATFTQVAPPSPGLVPLTARRVRMDQRASQGVIRRANAIQAWLDAGLVEGDLCGGSIGPADLAPGIVTAGTAPGAPPSAATPRPLEVPAAKPAGRGIRPTAAQLRVNQRIAQAALRRANALAARIARGLTGGDIRDGQVTQGKLFQGLAVRAAPASPPPAPSATDEASARAAGRPVHASAAQLLVNRRIARAAHLRLGALVRKLATGFTGDDLKDGTITAADLAPELRP